ncbi:MAG: protein translocase subunit SecF [bacterium]|nr:protein translocase subunit SecF [bacterium]
MNFSRFRIFFITLSVLSLVSLFSITYGKYGGFASSITFNGGIRFSILLPPGTGGDDLKKAATEAGFDRAQVRLSDLRSNKYDLELGPDVQSSISEDLRKLAAEQREKIAALRAAGESIPDELNEKPGVAQVIEDRLLPKLGINKESVISRETIAASYGANLFWLAVKTLIYTIIAIGLYLTFRFDFPFALGASFALIHDLLMTIGFIGALQIEPSIPVLAAVLTILGYSINDTIVIFDRIRENVSDRQQATIGATVDLAITQTLSRTLITSLLTLLALVALLMSGAESLADFAVVIIFGILVGTYSSIFIASHFVQFYEELRGKWKTR